VERRALDITVTISASRPTGRWCRALEDHAAGLPDHYPSKLGCDREGPVAVARIHVGGDELLHALQCRFSTAKMSLAAPREVVTFTVTTAYADLRSHGVPSQPRVTPLSSHTGQCHAIVAPSASNEAMISP
jgi:hypothetical protein